MNFDAATLKKFAPWIAAGAIAGGLTLFMKKGSSNTATTDTASQASISSDAVQQALSENQSQTNSTLQQYASETNSALKDMASSYNDQIKTISGNLTTLQAAMQDNENQYNSKITELTNNLNTVNSKNQQLQNELSNATDKANNAYAAIHELQTSTAKQQQTTVKQDAKTSSGGTSLSGQVVTGAKWYSTSTDHNNPDAKWTAYDSSGNKIMNGYVADSHGVAEVKGGQWTGKYVETF